MKTLFQSQTNINHFIILYFVYCLGLYLVWGSTEGVFEDCALALITFIVTYVALSLWVNRFYFYDNKIKIVYFFRFINRVKEICYSEIALVKYMHNGGKGNGPLIILKYMGKEYSVWHVNPSNSFTHRNFKKRQEILKFLKSKGIPIEINSVFERDAHILE